MCRSRIRAPHLGVAALHDWRQSILHHEETCRFVKRRDGSDATLQYLRCLLARKARLE
ncbi:hypothetical protein HanXRQr2_Chr01g0009761 [Helianthus annuus]|uniref:Uncharacterized protein n=1 Tax=Helianthus annuus TaxID=4232 RepID=A0A251VKR6_HELAN|nr:hypothetical protein HanXRQr2_Chr01g0009761 [Helianthus annuus]KAJ0955997.1 hypothetical protein HanPSC8_Chr01g0009481 [Helianthus annuus]